MATPTPSLLEARALGKRFGARRVVDGVSLAVGAGEAVALVGESGSGKSTIARLLTRLVDPDEGELRLDGHDVLVEERRGPSLGYRAQLQMVFQDPFASLNPLHSVRHHLARPLLRHGRATRATHDARAVAHPGQLSGGQRQRVAIARALAVEPRVLIADEPTSMLDASVRMGALGMLQALVKERRIALLLITHDLATARLLCDRVMVLFAGRVVEEGPAEQLLSAPSHPYTRSLLAALPRGVPRHERGPARADAGASVTGCPFAPRCPEAVGACRERVPELVPSGPASRVRCLLRGVHHE